MGLIQPLLRYSYNYFLTSLSSTSEILYHTLAGGSKSGSKSIFYLIALLGGAIGFLKILLNSLHINSQCEGPAPSTLVLSPSPNSANTPLMSSNEKGCNKPKHARQPHFTSASIYFTLDRVMLAIFSLEKQVKYTN